MEPFSLVNILVTNLYICNFVSIFLSFYVVCTFDLNSAVEAHKLWKCRMSPIWF